MPMAEGGRVRLRIPLCALIPRVCASSKTTVYGCRIRHHFATATVQIIVAQL
jgi:hypothetical protein